MLTAAQLDALAEEVHALHIARLDLPLEDLKPKPFVPRARPNTALISEAVARKIIARQIAKARERKPETV